MIYISCLDEVRYSFVSHLSKALCQKGINDVFVDSKDLLSEEAQQKVERARVSVIVLPGNRKATTASAFLDKLGKILECQKNDDQVVIPVLYGVRIVEGEWLSKLKEMTSLSPFHPSRNECTDSELVEDIARDVYEKLYHMGRIGICSKLLEIENIVDKESLGIRCVGIWGMPGIGKTTLAKAFFDHKSREFDAYCFIDDFDKLIHEKGLYRLLEEQFLKETPAAGGTITRMSLLRDKLNNKKVLVVLDDVCNALDAESFLGGFGWFGPNSLIIITSRYKKVFRLCSVNQIYEVQGLNTEEALQLISFCACINFRAEPNLYELSLKVIKYVNGHPLALSIYGRELKGKKKLSEMETAFLKLKRRPHFKIVDIFKSSYDTLDDSEKNIFLDIACFFQGEDVDYVMQLLNGCGLYPYVGIDVLIEKCLVTISENRVCMPNLIQDFGREMINGESIQLERRSRLWEPWSIKYVIEDNEHIENGEPKTTFKRSQGTEKIKGMFLDTAHINFDVKPAAFKNMLNLRLLKIYCSNPEIHHVINLPKGFLHSLPNELRLLHWENCPLQSLPQSFDPMHLVEINMPYSQLQKLWGGTTNLEMLRTIRLCHSHQLVDIDDLLKAQNLEVIDLQGCTKLQSFPATSLHLRVVNLSGCTKIKSFPEIPPNIEILQLQGTGITDLSLSIFKPNFRELKNLLTKIPGLSGVSSLKRNDLEPLTSLIKMSSSSKDPGKLICLELKGCSRLQRLPNMVNLEFLNVLDLSGCLGLETIQGFPRNLKELNISGTAVREVPELPQSLELFNAHNCVSLKSVHLDFQQLPMHYTFSNCFDLSPQVVKDFLAKVLAYVKHMPRDLHQELNKTLAFSFCAPSHVNENLTLDLQPGSSVMMQLNPSWRGTLVGFAMLVEVAFSNGYYDASGFGIRCVCRWKNKKGQFNRLESSFHYEGPGEAIPNVQKEHVFIFSDVKVFPSTDDEINNPDILADLVVFEFFPVNKEGKRLDDYCTVTRCGLYIIAAETEDTSFEMSSLESSLDPMDFSGNEDEEVLIDNYNGLREVDKALFLYIACMFNDEDIDLVAPLIATVDLDISSGLKVLAIRSFIHVSSNGKIVMHCLLQKMGKEILYRESLVPGSWKDFDKVPVASSPSPSWIYDVFVSNRGSDLRKNFVSYLLDAFRSKGLRTFDDKEIPRGDSIEHAILQAIRESRILIVVFSENYASSSWLLNELVEIAKSKAEFGQMVIPIFYNLDPSDVEKQIGNFGKGFTKTCKNKTKDEIQRWREALTDIANISGYLIKNWDNEAEMVEKIVNDVLREVNTTTSKNFDDFVGIEDHISKVHSLLCLESEVVSMVGIWGPSGIGKSIIARGLYNNVSRFFRSIFVNRDFARKTMKKFKRAELDEYDTKLQLQTQFLSEVLGEKYIKVDNLGMVRERLKDKDVLIILDDVDDQVLLDALVGQTRWFGSGSRIIVVTQDKGLLKSHGIDKIYKVDLPSKKQALQMFCRSAFRQNYPPVGFMELAVEVSETVGSLPLGLNVLGSSLRGRDKTEWVEMLPWIRKSLDEELEKLLKLTYDRLNDRDKVIFLHIACLFNHETVEYVTRLLADRDLNVVTGLTSLAEKSLIHITEHGNIMMHQLQQKLGREIVRKESPHEPGGRQFLVDSLDVCEVLEYKTGAERVLGISLDISQVTSIFCDGLSGMKNLRFLKFYKSSGNQEVVEHLYMSNDSLGSVLMPTKLRLLHWEAYPELYMPKIRYEKIVEITMEGSKLIEMWSQSLRLGNLKIMNLRYSSDLLRIPDLSYAPNLEKLNFGGCSSLTELPSSIRNLHKLMDLDMEGCINLEVLPTDINLKSLNFLNLKGCSKLRTFPEISRNISKLYLDETAIEEIPLWIENISRLTSLSINGCNKLEKISPNISTLKLLMEVDISNCEALDKDSWHLRRPPFLLLK